MCTLLNSISSYCPGQLPQWPLVSTILKGIEKSPKIMVLLVISVACQSKSTSFESFDSKQWIQAPITCQNYRSKVIDEMEAEFEKFIGMNETEVVVHLGNPSETHLYTRGQKFFSYRLACGDSLIKTKSLRIRFSALDYVNEVLVLD